MKCQNLFSGKNKKNISKCRLLKILPRVLSVKVNIPAKWELENIKVVWLGSSSHPTLTPQD